MRRRWCVTRRTFGTVQPFLVKRVVSQSPSSFLAAPLTLLRPPAPAQPSSTRSASARLPSRRRCQPGSPRCLFPIRPLLTDRGSCAHGLITLTGPHRSRSPSCSRSRTSTAAASSTGCAAPPPTHAPCPCREQWARPGTTTPAGTQSPAPSRLPRPAPRSPSRLRAQDLKPENIVVSRNGVTKLTDFGAQWKQRVPPRCCHARLPRHSGGSHGGPFSPASELPRSRPARWHPFQGWLSTRTSSRRSAASAPHSSWCDLSRVPGRSNVLG